MHVVGLHLLESADGISGRGFAPSTLTELDEKVGFNQVTACCLLFETTMDVNARVTVRIGLRLTTKPDASAELL